MVRFVFWKGSCGSLVVYRFEVGWQEVIMVRQMREDQICKKVVKIRVGDEKCLKCEVYVILIIGCGKWMRWKRLE